MRAQHKEYLTSIGFYAPYFCLWATFTAFPVFYGLYISLLHWNMVAPPQFVGLANYAHLFTDRWLGTVATNTVIFVLEVGPASVIVPFFVALLLNQKLRGISAYRTLYFLPLVTSMVAIGLVWRWVFDGDYGLVNYALGLVSTLHPKWLDNPHTALQVLAFIAIWKGLPIQIIFYLAALQNIPPTLYEAADIDGAGRLRKTWSITWPLVSPTVFLLLTLSIIGAVFGAFDLVSVLTQGGPLYSTNVISYYIYQQAFQDFNFGFGSAMAYVTFVFVFIITLVQWYSRRHWVHYTD